VHLALYVPLVVPLLAAAGARPLASRLPPQAATWLLTAAAVALAGLSTACLGLLALAAVVRIPLVTEIGHMSGQVLSRDDPASLSVSVIAGVLLTAVIAAACRAGWLRARALVSAARHARCLPGSGQVVVIPEDAADAYAMPGWPGRIVVTSAMLDALTPAERHVLLTHERAHASCHHYLFTALTYFAAAANPLLRPVAAAVTYTVERWADEEAARACGDRRLAARAIGKAALASSDASGGPSARARSGRPAGAAWAAITGIAGASSLRAAISSRGAGPVPRRVAALLAPPPRIRPLLVAAVAAVVLVSGLARGGVRGGRRRAGAGRRGRGGAGAGGRPGAGRRVRPRRAAPGPRSRRGRRGPGRRTRSLSRA
jgi:Zn-dependent protease with chaperone function